MNQDNPILNNPYQTPLYHYATFVGSGENNGQLDYDTIEKGRRPFIAELYSALPQKIQGQGSLLTLQEFATNYKSNNPNKQLPNYAEPIDVNLVRSELQIWREAGYPNTTRVTRDLLKHWFEIDNPKTNTPKLFFAQREAIESAIWLNEIARDNRTGSNTGSLVMSQLANANKIQSENLPRVAFKMATGTGKTVVMAAMILYHYLNRNVNGSDTRFADNFLLIAPNITIKDRLGVLRIMDKPQSGSEFSDYYHQREMIPPNYAQFMGGLNQRIVITNYHAFELKALQGNKKSPFDGKGTDKKSGKESFNQVIKRVLKNFKPESRLLVLNDEAHHCYLPRDKGKNNETDNSADENVRAAVWFTGLLEIAKKFKLQQVYDFSATPYYLQGSGYIAYSLFPWVISSFDLTEAIEAGLVKIPFMPEVDSSQNLQPKLRDLFQHIKDDLPKKGQKAQRKENAQTSEANVKLPELLESALKQFYEHYETYEQNLLRNSNLFNQPPVFIVVCNNTTVSKEVFKWLAGYEFEHEGQTTTRIGKCSLFSNYEADGSLKKKPPTLVIDSVALESSDQINEDFKHIFKDEITRFKEEYRTMYGDKSVEDISDADLMREMLNTVGKVGKMGAHIRCVVSVGMLTEGWDANTVTHIVGLRAFGSQLLCEQVVGRALRRKEYVPQYYRETQIVSTDRIGNPCTKPSWELIPVQERYRYKNLVLKFPPEYAHIIGVPFRNFKGGTNTNTVPAPLSMLHIHALDERADFELTFPNVQSYRQEIDKMEFVANFDNVPNFKLDFTNIPAQTWLQSAFSDKTQTLQDTSNLRRRQEVIYTLTHWLINHHFCDAEGNKEFYFFPKLRPIVEMWYDQKLELVGELDLNYKNYIAHKSPKEVTASIFKGITQANKDKNNIRILPILNFYNKTSSTQYVNQNTSKPCLATKKSHLNYAPADTQSKDPDANFWEHIATKAFEELDFVRCYAKNAFLEFKIPYEADGKWRDYYPDFIVQFQSPTGERLNLIVEITGANTQYKSEKAFYTKYYWLPAVNAIRHTLNLPTWDFLEVAGDIKIIKHTLLEKYEYFLKNLFNTMQG